MISSATVKHVVGFSGGIDSQACARWVLNRYPKEDVILLNSLAGRNEHPITVAFIEWYNQNVHPVSCAVPRIKDLWKGEGFAETRGLDGEAELTFGQLIKLKGRSPSATRQFCTSYLKLIPSRRWLDENLPAGVDYRRYTGLRRDESQGRVNTPFEEWDDFFDCDVFHPLADWTKQMCFDYVRAHGERVNPLYTLGFNRVGCAPCINSSKADILNWATRFPEMLDKVRAWECDTGLTFFAPRVPGLAMNTIDQVIEWAKTERGGSQYALTVLYEKPSCESRYGLCE